MTYGRTRTIGLLCMATLPGCGSSSLLEPIVAEDIEIALAVSGGFIGQSYAFRIDGEALEVVGVRCDAHCEFEEGELIVPISEAQVTDLARRLEVAGIFSRAGDYGADCCDQIGYELSYRKGDRTARVQGTDQTIPTELMTAMSHVGALGWGRVPMLVSPDTDASDWPTDPYTLGEVEAEGMALRAEVTYGGGCASHRMDLVGWGGWMESDPVQINALITHDDGDDACDAIVSEERVFDLAPLARAWAEAYGPGAGPIRIDLRLWDPVSGSPVGRVIELEF